MPARAVRQAVLQKVVDKIGGVLPAAVQLDVEPSLLSRFLDGAVQVPDAVLLRAVDIVLEDELPAPAGGHAQPFDRSKR
jgi:hypothetical protein